MLTSIANDLITKPESVSCSVESSNTVRRFSISMLTFCEIRAAQYWKSKSSSSAYAIWIDSLKWRTVCILWIRWSAYWAVFLSVLITMPLNSETLHFWRLTRDIVLFCADDDWMNEKCEHMTFSIKADKIVSDSASKLNACLSLMCSHFMICCIRCFIFPNSELWDLLLMRSSAVCLMTLIISCVKSTWSLHLVCWWWLRKKRKVTVKETSRECCLNDIIVWKIMKDRSIQKMCRQ